MQLRGPNVTLACRLVLKVSLTMLCTIHQLTSSSTTIASCCIAKLLALLLPAMVFDCNRRRNCLLGTRSDMDRQYGSKRVWVPFVWSFGLLALAHLHRTIFGCKRIGTPSFGYNKHMFTSLSPGGKSSICSDKCANNGLRLRWCIDESMASLFVAENT